VELFFPFLLPISRFDKKDADLQGNSRDFWVRFLSNFGKKFLFFADNFFCNRGIRGQDPYSVPVSLKIENRYAEIYLEYDHGPGRSFLQKPCSL